MESPRAPISTACACLRLMRREPSPHARDGGQSPELGARSRWQTRPCRESRLQRHTTTDRLASSAGVGAKARRAPTPTRPCRPRDVCSPSRRGPEQTRAEAQHRSRPAPAPRRSGVQRATGSPPARGSVRRGRPRRRSSSFGFKRDASRGWAQRRVSDPGVLASGHRSKQQAGVRVHVSRRDQTRPRSSRGSEPRHVRTPSLLGQPLPPPSAAVLPDLADPDDPHRPRHEPGTRRSRAGPCGAISFVEPLAVSAPAPDPPVSYWPLTRAGVLRRRSWDWIEALGA